MFIKRKEYMTRKVMTSDKYLICIIDKSLDLDLKMVREIRSMLT